MRRTTSRLLTPCLVTLVSFGAGAHADDAAPAKKCGPAQLLDTVQMDRNGDGVDTVPLQIGGKAQNFLLGTGSYLTMVRQSVVDSLKLTSRPSDTHVQHGTIDIKREVEMPPISLGQMSSVTGMVLPIAPETDAVNGGFVMYVEHKGPDQLMSGQAMNVCFSVSPLICAVSFSYTALAEGQDFDFSTRTYQTAYNVSSFDGVLGLDILTRYDADLDFGKDVYKLLDTDHCPGAGIGWDAPAFAIVPIVKTDGSLRIPVMLDGQKFTAMIDTSASRSSMRADVAQLVYKIPVDLSRLESPLKDAPAETPIPGLSETVIVHGERRLQHTFHNLTFDDVTVLNPQMVIVPNRSGYINTDFEHVTGSLIATGGDYLAVPEVTIGMDILRKLHLYIAPKEGKIYISEASSQH